MKTTPSASPLRPSTSAALRLLLVCVGLVAAGLLRADPQNLRAAGRALKGAEAAVVDSRLASLKADLDRAQGHLREATTWLDRAQRNKRGHRTQALRLVQQASGELLASLTAPQQRKTALSLIREAIREVNTGIRVSGAAPDVVEGTGTIKEETPPRAPQTPRSEAANGSPPLADEPLWSSPDALKVVDSTVYEHLQCGSLVLTNAQVIQATPIDVLVSYDGGWKRLLLQDKNLPEELKQKYPYDPEKADAYKSAQAKQRAAEQDVQKDIQRQRLADEAHRLRIAIGAAQAQLIALDSQIPDLRAAAKGRRGGPQADRAFLQALQQRISLRNTISWMENQLQVIDARRLVL